MKQRCVSHSRPAAKSGDTCNNRSCAGLSSERDVELQFEQTKLRKIGVYGGTFDPPHYGHLLCAEWTREWFNLDRVLFVTGATPPNKVSGPLDAEDRHEMVVAAVSDNPWFQASRVELELDAERSYTLLTMRELRRQYGTDVDLWCIISSEYLNPTHEWFLPKWMGAEELFQICRFLIFPRDHLDLEQSQQWAAEIPNARIDLAFAPSPPLSSTLIRNMVAEGKSSWYTTPWAVQQIIRKKGHYRTAATPPLVLDLPVANPKRIGLYGGQFDPIHYGHLLRAEWTRQQAKLDRVLFVTSANPPNNKSAFATAEARHEMVVAAVAENPYFEASRMDLDRNSVSYAILNVEQIRKEYGDESEIFLLVSSDYVDPQNPWHLRNWHEATRLFELVEFLIFPRKSSDIDLIEHWASLVPDASIDLVYAPAAPVTSEMIRGRVQDQLSIRYTTPWVVQQSIERQGLYRPLH
jgi:nicotinate-nucleotide adenylyltransferase